MYRLILIYTHTDVGLIDSSQTQPFFIEIPSAAPFNNSVHYDRVESFPFLTEEILRKITRGSGVYQQFTTLLVQLCFREYTLLFAVWRQRFLG